MLAVGVEHLDQDPELQVAMAVAEQAVLHQHKLASLPILILAVEEVVADFHQKEQVVRGEQV
jgi:hypothetical protein